MNKRYDAIIVGAGNAGLVAAAKTAAAGYKVLLLEKHNIPGGCATSFRRGRFEFEASLHELCSVGTAENPKTVYKIFDELGAEVNWKFEENLFRAVVKGESGYDVTLRAGYDGFLDSMDEAVPGCRESVKNFIDLIDPINEAMDYMAQGKYNPIKLMNEYGDFIRTASSSVEEVMNALDMPKKAQNIINTYWCYLGVPTNELNALHFLSMVNDYVRVGAAMPNHRSHELSLALVKVFEKSGGEVLYNTEVDKFLYNSNGSAIGVQSGNSIFFAKEIISNIIPDNVIKMSNKKFVPEYSLRLANARNYGVSIVTVYLGLDCTKEELGIKDYTTFIMCDQNPRVQEEERTKDGLCIVNCLNCVIPDATPEGTCSLFFSALLYGSDLPKNLRVQDYKKFKNALADKYITDYEKVMGIDVKSHIEEISVATPVTFARYLGTPDGTIYGYKVNSWDNIIARTANEKNDYSVKHLHFCGGHYIRGDGYSSAYVTGESAANAVIKELEGK